MGISLAVHLVALFLYPRLVPRIPSGILPMGGETSAVSPEGTEVVNLVELVQEEEPEAPPPEEEEEPEPEAPTEPAEAPATAGEPGAEPSETEGEAGPSTAAEALRPRPGDLRLWAPVDPELTELSEEDYLRLILSAELEALNDSAAIAEELARRARDWTYTDEEGRRWGVSPGKLHLGDLTLPLPFSFSAPPSVREGMRDRVWEWDEIERGAASGAIRESWRERARAIRERKEAERRKADSTKAGGGGGGGESQLHWPFRN